jgi:hypothetical protein
VKNVGWLSYIRTSENREAILNLDERVTKLESQIVELEKELFSLKTKTVKG